MLPPEINIHRIQPPGRETRFREPFCASPYEYIDALATIVETLPTQPFALFGHSMGAFFAYKTAHEIKARTGREPEHLFVSAFRSPLSPPAPPIHDLPDAEFLEELTLRYDAIPKQILEHPEVLQIMLPIVRADLALLHGAHGDRYEPLRCPITAIGGHDDPWVNRSQLAEWERMTNGPFAIHMVAGAHFFLETALNEVLTIVGSSLGAGSVTP